MPRPSVFKRRGIRFFVFKNIFYVGHLEARNLKFIFEFNNFLNLINTRYKSVTKPLEDPKTQKSMFPQDRTKRSISLALGRETRPSSLLAPSFNRSGCVRVVLPARCAPGLEDLLQ